MTGNVSSSLLVSDQPSGLSVSPQRVLEQVVGKSASGCITFHDPLDAEVSWQIFVSSGQMSYATSGKGKTERLQCLFQKTEPELAKVDFSPSQPEYAYLCQWWRDRNLPMSSLRQLLAKISLEALVQILALPQARVEFNKSLRAEPTLVAVPLKDIPSALLQAAFQWQKWRAKLPSPFTRLCLESHQRDAFQEFWQRQAKPGQTTSGSLYDVDRLPIIVRTLRQNLSVYRSAHLLGVQPQYLATWLQPFLNAGLVSVLSSAGIPSPSVANHLPEETPSLTGAAEAIPETPTTISQPISRPVIACIDDSKTIQKQVRGILEMAGYDVLSITEPAQALTSLVRQKPAVILMDVNMPDIDGYELCSMLRQSRQLRDIPIMMLTGRDGILDRIKAKSLGVSYYLTKPFHAERLTDYIRKILQNVPTKP